MNTRVRGAVGACAAALAIAGCGSSGAQIGGFTYETTLTVYSDLPLQGPQGASMTSINDGAILALAQAHANGRDRDVSIALLNDADAQSGGWSAGTTSLAARAAGQDLGAIAYIGDFDSGATAISLPLINANDILQVSPGSPYAGLTGRRSGNLPGEPGRYYPTSRRTFARLVPTDAQEALATARFMRSTGVRRLYVLADIAPASAPYDSAIAALVAGDASAAGIGVAGSAKLDTADGPRPQSYAALVASVARSHPDAVLLGGAPDAGAVTLWRALHRVLPAAKLFAPSTLASLPFLRALGRAADSTYVTSPILPLDQYPSSARPVLRAYRRAFGLAATPYSLYGYEAMSSILQAIEHAHRGAANRRLAVIAAYFRLGLRRSVIGAYRIGRGGDTTATAFAGYRAGPLGKLSELRRLSGAAQR